jgi:glycosyltransferase involved in cell wall biosynthesis
LTDDVSLPGFDKNPFRYMARSACFVLSSRNEGLPGALIQAMACGTPVVATDCDFGPREIITSPGDNGLLAAVDDEVSLADGIARVLEKPDAAKRMGEAGRDAAQKFALDASVARYLHAVDPNRWKAS